jgi:hypothetical protein
MPRQCLVCQHERKAEIDRDLAANTAIPTLTAIYRVSEDSLLRHKRNHLPQAVAKAEAAQEESRADDLLGQVDRLKNKAVSLLLKAEAAGDYRTALAGIREARACLELLLEVEGEIDRTPAVNLTISPQWLTVRAVIIEALAPWPEAKQAIAGRLARVEGNGQ